MITQNVYMYDFEKACFDDISNYTHFAGGIIIKLIIKSGLEHDTVLFDIPGTAGAEFKIINVETEKENFTGNRISEKHFTGYQISENYIQYGDESGVVPVIRFKLCFESEHVEWKWQTLDLPLTLYDAYEKDVYCIFDGVRFWVVFNGERVNYNYPYGVLPKPTGNVVVCNAEIAKVEYSNDIRLCKRTIKKKTINKKMNYYSPYGHNTFAGDAVNFYHDGIYHLFYLADSHHHRNRWRCGAHHFEHIITKDFVTWTEVDPLFEITEQWQNTGTGTMFWFKDKYYFSYGLHTDRAIADNKLPIADMKKYFEENGKTKTASFAELMEKGIYPAGSAISVSEDGITFKSEDIVTNFVYNPSVYAMGEHLWMFSGGKVWTADSPMGPWTVMMENFPPCGETAPMRNSDECPSFFEWNGYKYLIMGFTGFWRTDKNSNEFFDSASRGSDIYDGLAVPMAVRTDDNRVIMTGWLAGIRWASVLVHRELVQFENGDLGSKWLPELMPDTEFVSSINNKAIDYWFDDRISYFLSFRIKKGKTDKLAIRVVDKPGKVCEFKLDFESHLAQFATTTLDNEKMCEEITPLYKAVKQEGVSGMCVAITPAKVPALCGDYSIANVDIGNDEFVLKMIVHNHKKMNTTIIDVEIDGQRTMITNRAGFFPVRIYAIKTGGVTFEQTDIYKADI